jgi:hypothetical protein
VRHLWIALIAAAVFLQACDRCHTLHYEIVHEEGYYDEFLKEYIPEHCSARVVCDIWCKDIDQGRQEAHKEHRPLQQVKDEVDSRCTWEDGYAGLK